MKPVLIRLLLVALLSLYPGMARAEASPAAASGIEGVILMSPAIPGPLKKDAPEAVPVAQMTFDVQQAERKVASFTTDAEGHFQVSLPPGHYVVARHDPGAAVGQWRFEADVAAGQASKVHWVADSGMR